MKGNHSTPQLIHCKKQNTGGEVRPEVSRKVSRKEKHITCRRSRKENGTEFSTTAVEARRHGTVPPKFWEKELLTQNSKLPCQYRSSVEKGVSFCFVFCYTCFQSCISPSGCVLTRTIPSPPTHTLSALHHSLGPSPRVYLSREHQPGPFQAGSWLCSAISQQEEQAANQNDAELLISLLSFCCQEHFLPALAASIPVRTASPTTTALTMVFQNPPLLRVTAFCWGCPQDFEDSPQLPLSHWPWASDWILTKPPLGHTLSKKTEQSIQRDTPTVENRGTDSSQWYEGWAQGPVAEWTSGKESPARTVPRLWSWQTSKYVGIY